MLLNLVVDLNKLLQILHPQEHPLLQVVILCVVVLVVVVLLLLEILWLQDQILWQKIKILILFLVKHLVVKKVVLVRKVIKRLQEWLLQTLMMMMSFKYVYLYTKKTLNMLFTLTIHIHTRIIFHNTLHTYTLSLSLSSESDVRKILMLQMFNTHCLLILYLLRFLMNLLGTCIPALKFFTLSSLFFSCHVRKLNRKRAG
mmetsp:Transcript_24537/g.31932  ORF Transcript_24537/g.31932 Transcript_24537/m.31932 type:complete len:200 (-) Transcript_24537:62-661(-)